MIGGIGHGTMEVKMTGLGIQEVIGPETKEVKMIDLKMIEVKMIDLGMMEVRMIGLRMKVVMMTDQIQHLMAMERLLLVIVSSAKLLVKSQVIFTPTQA